MADTKDELLLQAVKVLEATADTCDEWAEQSRFGGWSTHQVQANKDMANKLRREASVLRRGLSRIDNAELTT